MLQATIVARILVRAPDLIQQLSGRKQMDINPCILSWYSSVCTVSSTNSFPTLNRTCQTSRKLGNYSGVYPFTLSDHSLSTSKQASIPIEITICCCCFAYIKHIKFRLIFHSAFPISVCFIKSQIKYSTHFFASVIHVMKIDGMGSNLIVIYAGI